MKTILKLLFSIIFILLFTSCSTFHNGIANFPQNLPSSNYVYVKSDVSGSASTSYVLGLFGGATKTALVADAKKDLSTRFPLKNNQAYINTTFNLKTTMVFGPVILITTCVITADIIEFK